MKKALWAAGVLLILVAAAYFGLMWTVSRTVAAQMEQLVEKNPAVREISYDTLRMDLLDPSIHLNQVRVTLSKSPKPVSIDRITLFDIWGYAKPENKPFHVALSGVAIGRELIPEVYEAMATLGYQELVLDAECFAGYQTEGGRVDIQQLKVGARGMGEVEIRLQMANVDIGKFQKDPKAISLLQILLALPAATVSSAGLNYTDESLARRLLSMKADEGDTFGDLAISRIDQLLDKEKREVARGVFTSVRDFLKSPEQIAIDIQPQVPVSFLQLAMTRNLPDFIGLVGLTVRR